MNAGKPEQSYDLFLRPDGARFVWTIPDRGIALYPDGLSFALGGESRDPAFEDIAAVHLQTNAVGQSILGTCRIRFADDSAISVLSSGGNGLYDGQQAALYGSFVRDLHARLAALPNAAIEFTAGYSAARRQFGLVILVIAAAFFLLLPTVLLLKTKELSLLSSLYFGALLLWPLYRLVMTNTPNRYDPRSPPAELIDL